MASRSPGSTTVSLACLVRFWVLAYPFFGAIYSAPFSHGLRTRRSNSNVLSTTEKVKPQAPGPGLGSAEVLLQRRQFISHARLQAALKADTAYCDTSVWLDAA
jgi:hypothetical protein